MYLRTGPAIHSRLGKSDTVLGQIAVCDTVDILGGVGAVRDRVEGLAVRPCMGVDAGGGHLLRPDLRRLCQLLAGSERRSAVFSADGIGAVDDLLFDGVHILGILPFLGGWAVHQDRRLSGVVSGAVHLHAVLPEHVESHSLPNVPELDVVIPANIIRLHLHPLSVHIDGLGAALCQDACSVSRGAAYQRCSDGHAGEQQPNIFSSACHFHKIAILSIFVRNTIPAKSGQVEPFSQTASVGGRTGQISFATTHHR